MKLTRTRASYELIIRELGDARRDQFIESCLAQYLAVTFYSEMEERVAEIISSHLKRFTGSRIGRYLAANMDSLIRRTPKSDMAKLVGSLDEAFRTKFEKANHRSTNFSIFKYYSSPSQHWPQARFSH